MQTADSGESVIVTLSASLRTRVVLLSMTIEFLFIIILRGQDILEVDLEGNVVTKTYASGTRHVTAEMFIRPGYSSS